MSIHSVVEEESPVDVVHDIRGNNQHHLRQASSSDEGHSSVFARVVQERHEGGHGRSVADE